MSDAHPDQVAPEPGADMLAELGSLAYGLFVLAERGDLTEVVSLPDSRATRVPAPADPVLESDSLRHHQALLGELGSLGL